MTEDLTEDCYAYILVEFEPYWKRRIEQSRKGINTQSFVRGRGRAGPKKANVLLFYVTKPTAEIRGRADFLKKIAGKPDELWNLHSSETVFESRQQYDDFVEGRALVTFIQFQNLIELEKPISLKDACTVLGTKAGWTRFGKCIDRKTFDSLMKMGLQ